MRFIGIRNFKVVSILVVLSVVLNPAYAGLGPTPTPELRLLEKTSEIQGKALTAQELQTQMGAAVSDYVRQYDNSTVSFQDQSERFQQAMIDIGLYTPVQAATIMSTIKSSANRMNQGEINTTQFAQEIQDLAGLYRPAYGAQFSMTPNELVYLWMGGTATGIGLAIWGFHSGNTALGLGGLGLAAGVTGFFVYLAQGA